jgi:hypothetical protein
MHNYRIVISNSSAQTFSKINEALYILVALMVWLNQDEEHRQFPNLGVNLNHDAVNIRATCEQDSISPKLNNER